MAECDDGTESRATRATVGNSAPYSPWIAFPALFNPEIVVMNRLWDPPPSDGSIVRRRRGGNRFT